MELKECVWFPGLVVPLGPNSLRACIVMVGFSALCRFAFASETWLPTASTKAQRKAALVIILVA